MKKCKVCGQKISSEEMSELSDSLRGRISVLSEWDMLPLCENHIIEATTTCPECGGRGSIPGNEPDPYGDIIPVEYECSCGGTGFAISESFLD